MAHRTQCSRYAPSFSAGLAWRPGGEQICCEIYSTGKANLPGSTRQRDLLTSFSRMVSELLRHSNRPDVCERIPERLRMCHRPKTVARDDAPVTARSKAASSSAAPASERQVSDLFGEGAGWTLEPLAPVNSDDHGDELGLGADASDDGENLPELAGF